LVNKDKKEELGSKGVSGDVNGLTLLLSLPSVIVTLILLGKL
jgi:hypothetical protein